MKIEIPQNVHIVLARWKELHQAIQAKLEQDIEVTDMATEIFEINQTHRRTLRDLARYIV